MTDRDSFLREVDEAVRQDQYKALWDKYGVYILVLLVLVVAAVAGYKGWSFWREKQAQEAGAEYTTALSLKDGSESTKAQELFKSLAEKGPAGYRVLARFQLAATDAKSGQKEKAIAAYDALATDASVDRILQGLATLQAAALMLDSADYTEMERRLKGLIDSDSAWRFSARELLGLSAYRLNNMREAEKQFSALVADQGTPQNMRERADMMLALIVASPLTLNTTSK